jgi:hypothetical protein
MRLKIYETICLPITGIQAASYIVHLPFPVTVYHFIGKLNNYGSFGKTPGRMQTIAFENGNQMLFNALSMIISLNFLICLLRQASVETVNDIPSSRTAFSRFPG